VSGVVVAILVPLLEFPTSETGIYGLIMNLISSITFVGVASLIYKFKRTLTGAIVALVAAAMSMTAVMMVANLFITPFYMGVSREAVVNLIPTMLLPFNAIKSILNASLTLCVYKPMTNILRRVGVAKAVVSTENIAANENTKLRSVLVVTIGGVVAVASLAIIFFVLGGSISFG